jgi:hypothetical protein
LKSWREFKRQVGNICTAGWIPGFQAAVRAAKQALRAAKAQVLAGAAAALAAQQHPNTQLQQGYNDHMQQQQQAQPAIPAPPPPPPPLPPLQQQQTQPPQQRPAAAVQQQQQQQGSSFVIWPCDLTPPQVATLVAAIGQEQSCGYALEKALEADSWGYLRRCMQHSSSTARTALRAAKAQVLAEAAAALAAQQHPNQQLQQRYNDHMQQQQQASSGVQETSEEPCVGGGSDAASGTSAQQSGANVSSSSSSSSSAVLAQLQHPLDAAEQQQQQSCAAVLIQLSPDLSVRLLPQPATEAAAKEAAAALVHALFAADDGSNQLASYAVGLLRGQPDKLACLARIRAEDLALILQQQQQQQHPLRLLDKVFEEHCQQEG